MALGERKKQKIFEKSDSGDKHFLSSAKQTEISASYANAEHLLDESILYSTGAIMYQIQLIEEDLDELRRYVTASMTIESDILARGIISGSQISSIGHITATGDLNISKIIASDAISSSNYVTANAVTSSFSVKFGEVTMTYDAPSRAVRFENASGGVGTVSLR